MPSTKEQLNARYAEAVHNLLPSENWRDERARLAREYADEVERLERRVVGGEVCSQNPDDKILVHVGTGKPAEKVRGHRI